MADKRLVLVNPVNPRRTDLTVGPLLRMQPLNLGIVAAVTPDSWNVELIDENWQRFRYREADLVGITAFTASANRAYEIANFYRQRGTPVVMGGIHASMCAEEASRFVDAVVVGEAESVWPRVLADAEAGRLRRIYRAEWPDLTGLPRPRRDLFDPRYEFASVQTSRGCPMDCEFCSVTAFNGRRCRYRPPEQVLDELQAVTQRKVFFVDDNLIGHGRQSRERALRLFQGMVERRLRKRWVCQSAVNFGNDERLLNWAAKSGCRLVLIGLESEQIDALQEINKRLNLRLGAESYAAMFQRIHRAGIAVLGAFIFGMDSDTPAKLRHRVDYVIRSGVDAMQATFLTPLPGTRLFRRLEAEGRLRYTEFPRDWEHYGMTEVVHRPPRMTPSTLFRVIRRPILKMYGWRVLVQKALRTLCETRDPTAAMLAWRSNAVYRKVVVKTFAGDEPGSPNVRAGRTASVSDSHPRRSSGRGPGRPACC